MDVRETLTSAIGKDLPMFKKLTPNLMVPDIDRALEFYENVLGFQTILTVPESGHREFAILGRGDVELMLQSKSSLEKDVPVVGHSSISSSIICYIEVADVKSLYESIGQKAEVIKPLGRTFYGMSEFYVRDPNGYVFGFAQRTS